MVVRLTCSSFKPKYDAVGDCQFQKAWTSGSPQCGSFVTSSTSTYPDFYCMTATPGPGQAAPPPASTSAGAARQAPTLYTSSLGTSSSSSSTSRPAPRFSGIRSRYAAFQAGRVYRSYAFLSRHKRKLLLGAGLLYFSTSYASAAVRAKKRDRIAEDTYLYFRVHDGAIVEAKSSATALSNLLLTQGNGSDEPARVMTLFEVIRALNWAATDDRIVSHLSLCP